MAGIWPKDVAESPHVNIYATGAPRFPLGCALIVPDSDNTGRHRRLKVTKPPLADLLVREGA